MPGRRQPDAVALAADVASLLHGEVSAFGLDVQCRTAEVPGRAVVHVTGYAASGDRRYLVSVVEIGKGRP